MKQLPDEKVMLDILKEMREMVQFAQKTSELATAIAYKYQHIAAGTYDPENMKLLCEALDVELPSEKRR